MKLSYAFKNNIIFVCIHSSHVFVHVITDYLSFFVLIRFLNAVFSLSERFCKLFSFFNDSITDFIVLCIFQLSASISFIDSRFNLREINYVLHSSKKIFEKDKCVISLFEFPFRNEFCS